ncbi:hypothetical protein GWC77_25180 [Paraburkholderia sp. NMBU_R16]|uniref:hypothetical protein n=1 Tax=Paraburkholderia sp. NMBU_R16 TaxID=2698676 RepID=UPI0015663F32|nr:hypothetical protein [Paraburkholderia sp. NMBU_R16]NRO99193.1 hypothetical protein [Paraburkholderia sp. NMBU_R16]
MVGALDHGSCCDSQLLGIAQTKKRISQGAAVEAFLLGAGLRNGLPVEHHIEKHIADTGKPRTIVTRESFREARESARRNGYAINDWRRIHQHGFDLSSAAMCIPTLTTPCSR